MDIVIRATAMFAVVYVLLRLMGKRELSQMAPFEVVTLVVIGDLVQQGVTHNDFSVTGAIIAIATFAFWTLLFSMISLRFPSAKPLLEGGPTVLVHDGRVIRKALARSRMTETELNSEMRLAGIDDVGDVKLAVIEPNGKISFIEKSRQSRSKQQDDESVA